MVNAATFKYEGFSWTAARQSSSGETFGSAGFSSASQLLTVCGPNEGEGSCLRSGGRRLDRRNQPIGEMTSNDVELYRGRRFGLATAAMLGGEVATLHRAKDITLQGVGIGILRST